MQQGHASVLRRSAIASRLVTSLQLQAAEEAARVAAGLGQAEEPPDELVARKLVEFGVLNRWQAEQLKAGRTKFTLGPYRVIDSLGQGGMGQVFRAEHSLMGRTVAIKVLPRDKSTPLAIASFTREIRAQAKLDHENLVRAFDAGHDGNVYFLVTEFVPGTDLRKLVRSHGKLGMYEAATIISQAAAGLAHAHECGLVHRDVKPGNLLVTPDGRTKLSDLGLAGSLAEATADPRSGKILGTADYLSPEHIRPPRNVTAVSDIYSLGCTLYYAATGKVPFPGGTTAEKARRHCEEMPLNPRRLNPELSEEFVEVLGAMMEKDPTARIQSAAEVIDQLSPWAGIDLASVLSESVSQAADSSSSRKLQAWLPQSGLKDTEADFDGDAVDTSSNGQGDPEVDTMPSGLVDAIEGSAFVPGIFDPAGSDTGHQATGGHHPTVLDDRGGALELRHLAVIVPMLLAAALLIAAVALLGSGI